MRVSVARTRWVRRILDIVISTAAALAIIAALETLAHALYPGTVSFDTLDREELGLMMDSVPLPSKLIVATGWIAGAFGGAWLALRICDWRWAGWIVAGAVLAGCIANLVALPHPLWMQAAALLGPIAGGALAARVHHKPYRGEPLLG